MKTYTIDTDDVFFAGDLHGEFPSIKSTIDSYKLQDCVIIVCGDIGIGFEKEEYYNQVFQKLTKTLKKKNIHCFFFRGNHDNKDFFDGEHFTKFEFVHVIPDYSVIQTPSRNILCVGGAISVDRTYRQRRMDMNAINYMKYHNCDWKEAYANCKKYYWENEPIVFDEDELSQLTSNNIVIDTVCTHTAPTMCYPFTKTGITSWMEIDANLAQDLDNERNACNQILDWLKSHNHPITNWYYAHFHMKHTEIIDNIKFALLDMCRNKLDIQSITPP